MKRKIVVSWKSIEKKLTHDPKIVLVHPPKNPFLRKLNPKEEEGEHDTLDSIQYNLRGLIHGILATNIERLLEAMQRQVVGIHASWIHLYWKETTYLLCYIYVAIY